MEVPMSGEPDHTRRWLINVGGAAIFSGSLPVATSYAQTGAATAPGMALVADDPTLISPAATALADYVATALDRELPPDVVARTKLHVLDTLAAMVSGSRLKPGDLAARYVDSLGGRPQAMVIGTDIVTSTVNAALANAMAAHADETDDTNPVGPVHLGCGAVSAALATAEFTGRTGTDLLRAVTLAYDIGARMVAALGVGEGSRRHSPSCLTTTFVAAAAAAAMLRLDPRQVRHAFSYAAQQASGIGFWTRDREHVEKAFDFAGMGARNGVTAATMVAMGVFGSGGSLQRH
jgi:2-methylcitrate dehydratase PrpD